MENHGENNQAQHKSDSFDQSVGKIKSNKSGNNGTANDINAKGTS